MSGGAVARRRHDLPLTLGAVAGVVVLLAIAVLGVVHARPIAFRSGSMSPTIPTGSLALVRRVGAADLRVGDVVTVREQGSAVTHRIVQLTRADGSATLQLQGDANPVPDGRVYRVTTTERVVGSVPWLGYGLAALTGPAGMLLAAVYVVWLLSRLATGAPRVRLRGGRHRGRRPARVAGFGAGRRRLVAGSAALVLAVGGGVASAPRAWAAWTDSVPVGTTTLTTKVISPTPSFTCGGLGILSVTFTWTAVAGATSYDLHYGSGGSQVVTVTGTSYTFISALSGGTAYLVTNVNYGSTTWQSVASTSRSYTVAVVSLCS